MSRFTIRDVLWLTVVVATGVAWWTDRQNTFVALRAERDAARQELGYHRRNFRTAVLLLESQGIKLMADKHSVAISGVVNMPGAVKAIEFLDDVQVER